LTLHSKEALMKLAAFAIAVTTILGTAAASAQSVEFRAGPGPDRGYVERDRDRDWRDSRARYRDRDDVVVIKKKRSYERWYRDYDEPRPGVSIRTY
jgi:hypothetical protein